MSDFTHPTEYRHYLRKYPHNGQAFAEVDMEEMFKCRYVSLSGKTGKVKNIYKENYAESSKQRMYIPDTATFDTSDFTLTLRWRSDECDDPLKWSNDFTEYILGHKFEYHDTFKHKQYLQLLSEEPPTVKGERLYGDLRFRFLEFKLTNWGGIGYNKSQI